MIVLDASVLIAYLDRDDGHWEQALRLLVEAVDKDTDLLVNPVTLAEVLVGPTRAGRQEVVLRVLAEVGVRVAEFPPDAPSVLARLRCTGLNVPDCCVLLTALDQQAAVASFDERLLRAAAEHDFAVVSPARTLPPADLATTAVARSVRRGDGCAPSSPLSDESFLRPAR